MATVSKPASTTTSLAIIWEGGGARGNAYAGSYRALHELGLIQRSTVAAGASIGAFFAVMVAMRLPPEIVYEQALILDFYRFIKPNMTSAEAAVAPNIEASVSLFDSMGFIRNYGLFQPCYLAEYMRRFIAAMWKRQCPGIRPSHQCAYSRYHMSGGDNISVSTHTTHQDSEADATCPRRHFRTSASSDPPERCCEYCSICTNYNFSWAPQNIQLCECDGEPTLGDLKRVFGCDVVMSSTVSREPQYISSRTHAHLPVFFAGILSAALPLVFTPIAWQGKYWQDGGITDNLPVGHVRDYYLPPDAKHRVIMFGFTANSPTAITGTNTLPFISSSRPSSISSSAPPSPSSTTIPTNTRISSYLPSPVSAYYTGTPPPFYINISPANVSGITAPQLRKNTTTPVLTIPTNMNDARARTPVYFDQRPSSLSSFSETTETTTQDREKNCINIVTNVIFGMAKHRGADHFQRNFGVTIPGLILLTTPGIESTTLWTAPATKEICIQSAYHQTMTALQQREMRYRWAV